MTLPLARLIADLVESRRCPEWRITADLGHGCHHIGRLPAGIAHTPEDAISAYRKQHELQLSAATLRAWPVADEGGR